MTRDEVVGALKEIAETYKTTDPNVAIRALQLIADILRVEAATGYTAMNLR